MRAASNALGSTWVALATLLSLVLSALSVPAQTPLVCGQSLTNTLVVAGQRHTYNYAATAGEMVTIRMSRLSGNLGPVLDLRDSNSVLLATGAGLIDRTLTNAGTYLIEVYDSGNNDTGDYSLALQRRTSPCDATALACGSVQAGAVSLPGELDAYSLTAAPGEVVTLRLLSTNTTLFAPRLELFDSLGRALTVTSGTTFTGALTNGGTYTLLVSYNTGSSRIGNYWLAAEKLKDACDFTALNCGDLLTNAITGILELDAYTFVVPAGGQLSRVRLESGTTGFTPTMELYDPLGRLVGSSTTAISGALTNGGTHTLLVGYSSGTNRTGNYRLAYERLTNACDALALNCGDIVADTLPSAGKLDAYAVGAAGGEVVTLRLLSTNTTLFSPRFELFDPAGRALSVSSGTTFTGTLTNGGVYTLLVSYNSGSSRTGNYWLAAEKLKDACDFVTLDCGDLLTNFISGFLELDAYTFTVPPGGQLSRLRLESATTGFTPTMELYDPLGRLVGSSTTAISGALTNSGTHTLLVGYGNGASRTGDYRLALERLTNACDALALDCGNVVTGVITSAGRHDSYTLNASGGEAVTLRLLSTNTTLFSPRLELFDPSGRLLTAASATSFTGTLTNGGVYTLLVGYNTGSSRTGNYWLTAEKVKDACDFTALDCGDLLTNSIGGFLELDAYTFIVPAGGQLSRLRLESATTGFTPMMELYDPLGRLISSSTTAISGALTNSGTHTLLVGYGSGASRTGDYRLAYERLTNACNALALACGDIAAGALASAGELRAYTLSAVGGEVVTLRLSSTNTTLFSPRFELFDPAGRALTVSGGTTFTGALTNGGIYTLLVSYNSGSSRTGNYWLAAEKLKDACDFASLGCGTFQTNALGQIAEIDVFTLPATAGDVVTLGIASLSAGFAPAMEFYDPAGRAIGAASTARLSATLTNSGVHTLLVRYNTGVNRIGNYFVFSQRLTDPCNALSLACGDTVSGFVAPDQFVTRQFSGATGEVVTLRMATTATAVPEWEVYDPDGVLLTSSGSTLTRTLNKTGDYTVLLFPPAGNPQIVDYALALQRLKQPCQAVALNCGPVQSASLAANGELDAYQFTGAAGEVWRLRLASLGDYFGARMELFDPAGLALTASTAEITRTLTNSGNYTALVSWDSGANSRLGDYRLAAQRLNAPCGAIPLALGQPASGSIAAAAQMDVFTFAGGPGPMTLCLGENSAALTPEMELYNSAGVRLASSTTLQIQTELTNSGNFHLLVQDSVGTGTGSYLVTLLTGTVSCATLDLQAPVVTVTAPAEGTFVTRGTSFAITWTSSDNGTLAAHDLLLSLDGGATYSMALATGLPGTARSFVWIVPDGVTTAGWRVRVLVRDAAGNVGFDDTEVQFLVIDPADILGILYRYDGLNRLTRTQYPDGSIITYAYDPAGNRTNWTVLAGTNADTDGDGLSDSWEMANGMDRFNPTDASADADGDHLTNREEFLLGTNPNDAMSGLFITAIEATGSTVRITFTSVTGKSYVVEQSSDLVPGSWISAGASLSGEGSLTQFTQTDSVLPMQRFFRVRWLP